MPDACLSFPPFRLDFANEQLWREGQLIPLRPKTFAILRYLAEHPKRLVTKEELLRAVWGDTLVSEDGLRDYLREIRQALCDDANAPRFVETVRGRGYRFLPATTTQPVASSRFQVPSEQAKETGPRRGTWNFEPGTSLVGRDSDLVQLQQLLEKAIDGERQLVFVTGEPGIGKTALIEAFLSGIGQQATGNGEQENQKAKGEEPSPTPNPQHPTPWFSRGQCIEQHGSGEAFLPILDALGRVCRGPQGEQLIEVLRKHAPMWLVQLPVFIEPEEVEMLQRKVQGASRERMLRELAEALQVFTTDHPLLLVLEDLHWSDVSTLDFLAFIARRKESARLLVIGTYRPVEMLSDGHPLKGIVQELYAHHLATELSLRVLSEADIAAYLTARLSFPSPFKGEGQGEGNDFLFLQTLARTLYQRTSGNPLFLVSLVNDLIKHGALVQTPTGWELKEDASVLESTVPDSIRHLVARQSERLSLEERHALEAASVAGMEFSAAAVAAALATDTLTVERHCEQLAARQQFLRRLGVEEWPDGTLAARYSFLHALYQQLWHERITPTQLQQHHLQIGQRKEQAYGERAQEIAAELAVRFEQGRDYPKAVQYLQQAGENAVRRSAHQEAIALLRRGIVLLPSLPNTADHVQHEVNLQLALGNALNIAKGYTAPEVGQAYARARELCKCMEGAPQMVFALAGLFGFHLSRAELESAEELATELLHFAQAVQMPALLVGAHQALGATLLWRGQFTAARAHLEQGITFYSSEQRYRRGILHPGVSSLIYMGIALWFLGYPDQAIARCYEGITLAHEIDQPFSRAFAVQWTAWLHLQRGEIQQAEEQAERLETISVDWAFPSWKTVGTLFRGWLHVVRGHREEGIVLIRQGIATHQARGVVMLYPASLATLAEAYGQGGKPEEGLKVLPEALTVMNATGQRHWEAELYRLKGELLLARARERATGNGQQGIVTDP